MFHDLSSVSVNLQTRSYINRQDLAHAPTDISSNTAAMYEQFASGYRGVLPTQVQWGSAIMPVAGGDSSSMGLSLPTNDGPGAPELTFVYGCTPQDEVYPIFDLVKCSYGPSAASFESSLIESDINPDETELSRIVSDFTPGETDVIGGLGGQFVPCSMSEVRAMVYNPTSSGGYSTGDTIFPSGSISYYTSNVWIPVTYQSGSQEYVYGSPTDRYIPGYGPLSPPSSWARGSIRQAFPGGGQYAAAVAFSAQYGAFKITRPPIKVDSGIWFCTTDWLRAQYLETKGVGSQGLTGGPYGDARLTNAIIFAQSDSGSAGLSQEGWKIKINYHPAGGASGISGGVVSSISVVAGSPYIGGDQSVSGSAHSYAITGFVVTISPGAPILIRWAALTHGGSAQESTFGLDASGNPYRTAPKLQYFASPEPLPVNQSGEVTIETHCYGDTMTIIVTVSGQKSMILAIAPQSEVYSDTWTIDPNSLNSSIACLNPYIQLDVRRVSGHFRFMPMCYSSWHKSSGMFVNVPFQMSTSYLNSDSTSPNDFNLPSYFYPKTNAMSDMAGAFLGNWQTVDATAEEPLHTPNYAFPPDVILDPRSIPGGEKGINALYLATPVNHDWSGNTWYTGISNASNRLNTDTGPVASGLASAGIGYSQWANDGGFKKISDRGIMCPFNSIATIPTMVRKPYPGVAVWAHAWANTQFCRVWPGSDLVDWLGSVKKTLTKYNIPTTQTITSLTDENISSFTLRAELDGCIIKKHLTLTIKNPNINIMSYYTEYKSASSAHIETNIVVSTPASLIQSSLEQSSQKVIKFSGFITNMKMNLLGDGSELIITAQDDFSLLMETLNYPSSHTIDGWYISDAISYLIYRTGIGLDFAIYDSILNSALPVSRIGRSLLSDIKAGSISFSNGSLKSNLSKALSRLLYSYIPMLYYDEKTKQVIVNSIWSTYAMGYTSVGLPSNVVRDSVSTSFNNTELFYELVSTSTDRHRGMPIWQSMSFGFPGSISKYGYKNSTRYRLDGYVQTMSEMQEFARNQERFGAGTVKPTANVSYWGVPPEIMFDNDPLHSRLGIGSFASHIGGLFGYESTGIDSKSKFIYANSTSISYNADENIIKGDVSYITIDTPLKNVLDWIQSGRGSSEIWER